MNTAHQATNNVQDSIFQATISDFKTTNYHHEQFQKQLLHKLFHLRIRPQNQLHKDLQN